MAKSRLSLRNSTMKPEELPEFLKLLKIENPTNDQKGRLVELMNKGEIYMIDENGLETKLL